MSLRPRTTQLTLRAKNSLLKGINLLMSLPKPSLDDLCIERGTKPDSNLRIEPVILVVLVLCLAAAVIWWLNRPRALAVRTVVAREAAGRDAGERTALNA